MNQLRLGVRLYLLLSLPMAGLLAFGIHGAWQKWEVARDYRKMERNAAVLDQIGDTVHELQKERARSAVFVNSKGARFRDELKAQRALTETQRARLRELLA